MENNPVKKTRWHDLPLRKFFMLSVFLTFCTVALLSGLIIGGCTAFQNALLPDSDSVYLSIRKVYEDGTEATESHLIQYDDEPISLPILAEETEDGLLIEQKASLTEYSIEKAENNYDRLTPKKKLAYTCCNVIMILAPAVLSLCGILLCSFCFFRHKLRLPLSLLSEATAQIAAQNLDFSLEYDCGDEMGDLCRSFSQMQKALYENNKKLWTALEDRKRLQASVAHDLRNPIAILQGYTEYLGSKAASGNLDPEKALRIAGNLDLTVRRMAQYTESIHTMSRLEDLTVDRRKVSAAGLAAYLASDFGMAARQAGKILHFSSLLPDVFLFADTAVLYRILENILGNALRFSKREIFLELSLQSHMLSVTVRDDGNGFQDFSGTSSPGEACFLKDKKLHTGMGISVSRILCEKHGGFLSLSNASSGGACVKISVDVSAENKTLSEA